MKKRSHRLLAVLLAASMVVGQGNFSAWAEGETTVQAEAAETAAAETPAAPAEAPTEKATEAPTEKATEVPTEKATEAPTEKATEAPTEKVTEAPTEKPTEAITEKPVEAPTEAPAEGPTETPTEAPAEGSTETPTEAPAEEPTETPTEAPSEGSTETPTEIPGLIEEVTEAGTTEAPTEKAPEELTEEGTDKETETESETAEKTTFTFSGNGMKVTVKLEKKNALPGTTQFSVKEITKKSSTNRWKKAQKLVANQVNQGHRRLAEARFYELSFLSDGKTIQPAGKMTVKMEYSDGLSLGLAKYAQGEAAAFAVGDSGVQSLGGVKLNASLKAAKAELTLKNQFLVGIAGIQNRQNDGSVITGADLESGLGEALNYAVVANRYDGPKMEYAAAGKGTPDDRTVDSAEILTVCQNTP